MNQCQRLSIRNKTLGSVLFWEHCFYCAGVSVVLPKLRVQISTTFFELPTGQSGYGRGRCDKVVRHGRNLFIPVIISIVRAVSISARRKFDYNRFVTTDAFIDSEESVLKWEDVEGRCRKSVLKLYWTLIPRWN